MKRRGDGFVFVVAALVLLESTLICAGLAYSQDTVEPLMAKEQREPDLQVIKPAVLIEMKEAQLRTPEDMEKAGVSLSAVKFEGLRAPFRPTIDPAEYEAAKLRAESYAPLAPKPSAPVSLAPPSLQFNFEGINQAEAGGSFPPDTHGAVGLSHFVEVVNQRVVVYNKSGTLLKSTSLADFFGASEFIFDPRVVYDQTWKRWIIVCTRVSASASDTERYFYLAVSQTANPTGAYFIYTVPFGGTGFNSGDWLDYPQLGMDQDAVLVTGNVFDSPEGAFKFPVMIPFAKARIYNGLTVSFKVFTITDSSGTLAPPIVLDQNKDAYFVSASSLTHLHLYRGTNLSNGSEATLVLQALVDVPDYAMPPNAPQRGTIQKIDTMDGRFVNASTQVGDSVWNVHTIELEGFAAPRFYQLDAEGAGANTVKQMGFFFESGTSWDFNASIAANALNEAFVTWSTTDVANATVALRHNARIRISGRQPSDPLGAIPAGSAVFTSSVALTDNTGGLPNVQRWGDYSAVSLDPSAAGACAANRRAWIVNEKINTASQWGSRIGRIGFCP